MSAIKLRKRVPKILVPILNRKEINKIFQTQQEVDSLNTLINESILIANSTIIPEDIKALTILKGGLKEYHISPKTTLLKLQHLEEITILYLAYCKENNTPNEYRRRVVFLTELLPALFDVCGIPTEVKKVNSSHMFTLSKKLASLPNRKHPEFRNISAKEYVNINTSKVMLPQSVNKYIKLIRGLVNYGITTGLYSLSSTIPTIKLKSASEASRVPLSSIEYSILFNILPSKYLLLLNVIYYSGLRPSEVHKSTIRNSEGVVCFDLRETREPLKTKSSYRVIPIHSKLLPHIEEIQELTYANVKSLSVVINKHIKQLPNPNGKSLYSARHSVVTNLINLGVDTNKVSSIIGHSYASSMTMGVYFGGYSTSQLKDCIELL